MRGFAPSFAAALLMASCDGAPEPDLPAAAASESPNQTDALISDDWHDLFGVLLDPSAINGSEMRVLYHCPEMADAQQFLDSLWPIWVAERDAWVAERDARPRPAAADESREYRDPMMNHMEAAGCSRYSGIVAADAVIASAGIPGRPDIYKNAARWIAFRTAGQLSSFYLVQNVTVD